MSTFQYLQSTVNPVSFQATLGGIAYNCAIRWNTAAQRLYITITDTNGNLLVSRGLTGSVLPFQIQSASFDETSGFADITLEGNHGYELGTIVPLQMSNCSPDAWNLPGPFLVTGDNTLRTTPPAMLGPITNLGRIGFIVNLVAGYIAGSTLVWYPDAQTFEALP